MQLASLMLIAASYLVDSSHTTAGFAVKHMMVATVRGQFDTVAGKVEIDAGAPDGMFCGRALRRPARADGALIVGMRKARPGTRSNR